MNIPTGLAGLVSGGIDAGLSAAGAPGVQQQHPTNPMQTIYNKPKVAQVMQMLATSGADAATMQNILAATVAPYQQQQAAMAKVKADLAAQATTMSATLPEGQAAAALATAFPQLQNKPIVDKTLTGAYGQTSDPTGLGLLNPSYQTAGAGVSTIDATGRTNLAQTLEGLAPPTGPTDWKSLTAYRDAARRAALIVGTNPTGTQAAIDFAESYWASKTGADPATAHTYGDPGAAAPPSDPSGQFTLGPSSQGIGSDLTSRPLTGPISALAPLYWGKAAFDWLTGH